MATLHEALKAHLINDGPVNALIDTRFYYLIVPQAVKDQQRMPCINFSRTSAERQVLYCHTDGVLRTVFNLDSYALRYGDVRSLANEVRLSLLDFRGFLGSLLQVKTLNLVNEIDLLDFEPGVFRVSQSWEVWHLEEN